MRRLQQRRWRTLCSSSASRLEWGWCRRWRRLPRKRLVTRAAAGAARSSRRPLGGAACFTADHDASAVGSTILLALGQAPATAPLAPQYLSGLAWGTTPALWFLAIRGFMSAVNRPEPGLWITLGAIPANAVLVYLLIHGELGLPRLELFGA